MGVRLGLKDIVIVPAAVSSIEHRGDCDPYVNDITLRNLVKNKRLPLFASPMAAVVNEYNYETFNLNGINTVIPRTVDIDKRIALMPLTFVALGLNEAIDIFINRNKYFDKIIDSIGSDESVYICIDIANGHMQKLIDTIKSIKGLYGDEVIVMAGNIANPETYRYYAMAGCDYVRCGIGVGSACTSSANGAVHYPMASLLYDIYKIKSSLIEFNKLSEKNGLSDKIKLPKIIADGGCSNFDDIIKCLALGADYIMAGKIFAQAFESASKITPEFIEKNENDLSVIANNILNINKCSYDELCDIGKKYGLKFNKTYYGMSTKRAQSEMGNDVLKTAEGIQFEVPLKYTLAGWIDNFKHYLRSAMSYCDAKTLSEFHPKTIQISNAAFNAYYK